MKNPVEKHIRQFEILALCSKINLTKSQLEDLFDVSADLIKLDFKELRAEGTGISSSKNTVTVANLTPFLKDKIDLYIRLRSIRINSSKVIDDLIRFVQDPAFVLTVITKSIEHNYRVDLTYGNFEIKNILALSFHIVNDEFRFIGEHMGIFKQYSLAKIKKIDFSDPLADRIMSNRYFACLKIKEIKANPLIDEISKYSFGGWINANKFNVQLELSGEFKDKIILGDQFKNSFTNASTIVSGYVNSLDELAKFIIINNSKIKALAPPELILKIKTIAKRILRNY